MTVSVRTPRRPSPPSPPSRRTFTRSLVEGVRGLLHGRRFAVLGEELADEAALGEGHPAEGDGGQRHDGDEQQDDDGPEDVPAAREVPGAASIR